MTTTSTMIEWQPGMDMPYTMALGEGETLAVTIPAKWLKPDRSGEPILLPPAVRYLDRLEALFTRQTAWTPGRIISLREAIRLTQEQFGQKLGVSKMTVSRWECGRMKPGEGAVEKMNRLQHEAQRKGTLISGNK